MTAYDLIATEERIVEHWRNGDINGLTHFSVSKDGLHEAWLVAFYRSNIKPTDWVFASHRAHYHFLLHGGTPEQLVDRCLQAHSMALYAPRFITSAIVAGVCGIAAGAALAAQQSGSGERVWCFCGDGAVDEGAFWEAVMFVHGRDLPCTFIVTDNNSSCGVTKEQRGIKDWPLPPCVIRHRWTPKYPHAGDGSRPQLKSQTPALPSMASVPP